MYTTQEKIERMKLELFLLRSELESYLRGDWRPEYYWTIGYNKIYTGRKIYFMESYHEQEMPAVNPDGAMDSTMVSGTISEGSNPSQGT